MSSRQIEARTPREIHDAGDCPEGCKWCASERYQRSVAASIPRELRLRWGTTDEEFEEVYQQTVDYIAGNFGSKETYRVFGGFLLARVADAGRVKP